MASSCAKYSDGMKQESTSELKLFKQEPGVKQEPIMFKQELQIKEEACTSCFGAVKSEEGFITNGGLGVSIRQKPFYGENDIRNSQDQRNDNAVPVRHRDRNVADGPSDNNQQNGGTTKKSERKRKSVFSHHKGYKSGNITRWSYCPKCSYRTRNKPSLKEHLNTVHSKVRPFCCLLCTYKGKRISDVVGHLERIHQEFYCRNCKVYQSKVARYLIKGVQDPEEVPFIENNYLECRYKCILKFRIEQNVKPAQSEEMFSNYLPTLLSTVNQV